MTAINFGELKQFNHTLWRILSDFFFIQDDGVHDVDVSRLRPEPKRMLSDFLQRETERAEQPKLDSKKHDSAEIDLTEPEQKEPEPDPFRIDVNEATERRKLFDQEQALARLEQYVKEQGLFPIRENLQAVTNFIEENLKGYWSAAGVDAAVANLGARGTNVLRWKPATPPATIQPAPTSEPAVRVLPNGEAELPLDATERQMRRASIAQLRDLAKRRGEGRQRRDGWNGSSF